MMTLNKLYAFILFLLINISMLINDNFQLDERLQNSSFHLINWPLSQVLLKNNADYPWLILVPRRNNLTEITEFNKADQYQLINEVNQLTLVIQDVFKPDKLNIGSLGNIVSQFHMHVVARFQNDPLWPHGVWQSTAKDKTYIDPNPLIEKLKHRLSNISF